MTRPALRLMSQGEHVRVLQQSLNTAMPTALPALVADGIFGQRTLIRVKEFQQLAKLIVDGIVGPNTWAALEAWLGGVKPGDKPGGGQPVVESEAREKITQVAQDEFETAAALVPAKHGGAVDPMRKLPFRRGDVACQAQPFQHHVVVHPVYQDQFGRTRLITIDGNSGATSTITCNDSPIGSWTHFFKVTQLP